MRFKEIIETSYPDKAKQVGQTIKTGSCST